MSRQITFPLHQLEKAFFDLKLRKQKMSIMGSPITFLNVYLFTFFSTVINWILIINYVSEREKNLELY